MDSTKSMKKYTDIMHDLHIHQVFVKPASTNIRASYKHAHFLIVFLLFLIIIVVELSMNKEQLFLLFARHK